jgi:hypothetical protein
MNPHIEGTKVKIVHLITGLGSGGSEKMLQRLIARMDRSRFSTAVVSMKDEGNTGLQIKSLGIPLYTLNMVPGFPGPTGFWKLLRILKNERPSILQTWLYHANFLGLLTGKLARVPAVVWNIRSSKVDMKHYSWTSALVVGIAPRLSAYPEAVVINSLKGGHSQWF